MHFPPIWECDGATTVKFVQMSGSIIFSHKFIPHLGMLELV